MKALAKLASIVAFFTLASACAVGWNHTSDAFLERNFFQHEADFDLFLSSLRIDEKLSMIGARNISYGDHLITGADGFSPEIERLGLNKGQWTAYQQQLRRLGLDQVNKGPDSVTFEADSPSLFNGDSTKGYLYSPTSPAHLKPSLDGYRIADGDKGANGWYVAKALKGHWYLYLFVSK
jgi:hypothetical protein